MGEKRGNIHGHDADAKKPNPNYRNVHNERGNGTRNERIFTKDGGKHGHIHQKMSQFSHEGAEGNKGKLGKSHYTGLVKEQDAIPLSEDYYEKLLPNIGATPGFPFSMPSLPSLPPALVPTLLIFATTLCGTLRGPSSSLIPTADAKVWAKPPCPPENDMAAAREQVVTLAMSHLGEKETPENKGEIVRKYTRGIDTAWCTAFVASILGEAHIDILGFTLRSNQLQDEAKQLGALSKDKAFPIEKGDIIFTHSTEKTHAQLVVCVNDDGSLKTVSGNKKDSEHPEQPDGVNIGMVRREDVTAAISLGQLVKVAKEKQAPCHSR